MRRQRLAAQEKTSKSAMRKLNPYPFDFNKAIFQAYLRLNLLEG